MSSHSSSRSSWSVAESPHLIYERVTVRAPGGEEMEFEEISPTLVSAHGVPWSVNVLRGAREVSRIDGDGTYAFERCSKITLVSRADGVPFAYVDFPNVLYVPRFAHEPCPNAAFPRLRIVDARKDAGCTVMCLDYDPNATVYELGDPHAVAPRVRVSRGSAFAGLDGYAYAVEAPAHADWPAMRVVVDLARSVPRVDVHFVPRAPEDTLSMAILE